MQLTLAKDDGTVLETWYVADEETTPDEIKSKVSFHLPVYDDRGEYESIRNDDGLWATDDDE